MIGWRFSHFDKEALSDDPFERLLQIFKEILVYTSGDVSEALSWLTELDKQYELTDDNYGISDFIEDLKKKGYISDKNQKGKGLLTPTAKMEIALRRKALDDIFDQLQKSKRGNHITRSTGQGDEFTSEVRPFQFGDKLDNIAISESLRNAQINNGIDDFRLTQDDLEVHETYYKSQTSTVLMIDISHSMILYGEDRITPAKKVAMALAELIKTRYTKDTLDIIVFGNDAWKIEVKDLPYLQVGPYHTNTVAGLELAMDILRRRKNPNKQIMMITDGKPTCLKKGKKYYKNAFGLDRKILNRTLGLATKCRKLNIPITTFMIATDPYLVNFVDQFTRANGGKAFYSGLQGLGEFIFMDYKDNKRKENKIHNSLKIKSLGKPKITSLGALRESGYQPKSIKDEMRLNLIEKIRNNRSVFDGVLGFDDTVLPDIERAILSRHNILLLGLRGQAKTRIARLMTRLLDEYVPVVSGSEINDDPMRPLSRYSIDLIKEKGDKAPIEWVHRDDRFVEKLATPDVSVADLIGDVDPIKAATLKLSYADDRVIHFGLVPRAHRSIFVLNELPDLQARIQVSLFNILQEGDLQIRGFKLRFPLDIQFVFTANPEDYTNRGSIVTPLKDRIESQILTHYPKDIEIAKAITRQESRLDEQQKSKVQILDEISTLPELISFQARESEYIDEKSGVSARLSISAMENLVSTAERRMLKNQDDTTTTRITDFWGVVPAITGKVELVYEGEQIGPYDVAMNLVDGAIKEFFLDFFPDPDKAAKLADKDPYGTVRAWFAGGNQVDLLNDDSEKVFRAKLDSVMGLDSLVQKHPKDDNLMYFFKELVLHGLAAFEIIGKNVLESRFSFSDPLAGMFDDID